MAGVFVDNHDTERNGATLNYKDGANYTLANVFMLAWPYGSPDINSGYEWSDADAGPPNNGQVNACWQDGWKCQHAWPEIKSMVAFRNATRGQAVANWWDDGDNLIAFGRGGKGYVVINHEGTTANRSFQTSLPAGTYCNVQNNTTVTVNSTGWFTRRWPRTPRWRSTPASPPAEPEPGPHRTPMAVRAHPPEIPCRCFQDSCCNPFAGGTVARTPGIDAEPRRGVGPELSVIARSSHL